MDAELAFDLDGRFQPAQQRANRAADEHRFTLFGGSRGPGKSYWLRWYLARYVILAHQAGIDGVRVGLFCEDYPTLRDRQISKIKLEFPAFMGEVRDSQEHGLGFHFTANWGGGVIALRNLDDPSKYQSAEFAAIGVDELTKNPVTTFDVLRGSRRWPGIKNTRFVGASNPGGIGHLWVRAYWGIQMPQQLPPELRRLAKEFAFVPALPDDNQYLPPEYWEELETLPPDLSKAWRHGDWSVFAGQVFSDWRYDRHVKEPEIPPDNWRHFRGLDWGYAKPFCCLWGAQDPDSGRILIYRELYETHLTDREQARRIIAATPRKERGLIYADPSMWTKKSHEDRTFSTADEYAAEGVLLTQADNDRMTGKRKMQTMLHEDAPDGQPLLMVTTSCTNLIRTLPALPYDKTNVEDVDSDAEDHCLAPNTLIATDRGDIPIQLIGAGDRVFTRRGYQKVMAAGCTRFNASLWVVEFSDGRRLVGTGNHPVLANGAFCRMDALRYGDIIETREELCLRKSLKQRMWWCSTACVSAVIQTLRSIPSAVTIGLLATPSARALGICIRKFGSRCMALFQRGAKSITPTATHSITILPIWFASLRASIYLSTRANTASALARQEGASTWSLFAPWLLSGINPRLAENGTRRTLNGFGVRRHVSPFKRRVPIVERLTRRQTLESRTPFAQTTAALHGAGTPASTTKHALARFAENLLSAISIKSKKPARVYVVRSYAAGVSSDVYNLTVDRVPEYFANGVVVHNCYDALRYLLTPVNPRPKRKPEDEKPLDDPLVKRIRLGQGGGMGSRDL